MKKFPRDIFVTGIGTNVGKTVVSAILTEALQADYWKPVQSGTIEGTDANTIKNLLSNSRSKIHREVYSFKAATVPSYAAELENVNLDVAKFILPETDTRLVVEGAGGLMVHLTDEFMIIDLIAQLGIPVILVSENYLGSINHTFLSIEALRRRGIDMLGIIYNGERSDHMRELISKSGIPEIGSIDKAIHVDRNFVKAQAAGLISSLQKHFVI